MIICPFKDLLKYAPVVPGLEEAVKVASEIQSMEPATVPLSGTNKILVQHGTTKAAEGQLLEAHREYLDVQYIVKVNAVLSFSFESCLERNLFIR